MLFRSNGSNGVRFFPNPASNIITFDLPMDQSLTAQVEVLDNTGKTVLRQKMDEQRAQLNVGALANGLYLFRVSNGQGGITRGKFEVSHD